MTLEVFEVSPSDIAFASGSAPLMVNDYYSEGTSGSGDRSDHTAGRQRVGIGTLGCLSQLACIWIDKGLTLMPLVRSSSGASTRSQDVVSCSVVPEKAALASGWEERNRMP